MSGNGGKPGQSSQDPSFKDQSFDDRLRAARLRQGLDKPDAAQAAGDKSGLGVGLTAGVELVAAEAVAVAIGYGLDRWLHTMPLFLIVFVILGFAAGILNVWRRFPPAGTGGSG
ncbi:MAG TPA: AtpZ/AtpI family protein [Acetobacteraceae bacterium]|nr:AtpZ/AtpI family protein [Acetobacteraceae bacterium]